jgi:glycosyltransferase involved in cell wall biosynthesis
VRYIGPVGPEQRSELLGGARALLHLISFDEPFGFSVVEAMACGTPVIAFDRGSMRELIDPGVTGFVVPDTAAAVLAVAHTSELDRAQIRSTAVARFGRERMIDEYLDVYARMCADA